MTDQTNGCQSKCWLWAAVAGVFTAAKLLLVSHSGFFAAVFLGLLVFGLLGALLVWAFCGGHEVLTAEPARPAAPVVPASVAAAAPVVAPKQAPAPKAQALADIPAQTVADKPAASDPKPKAKSAAPKKGATKAETKPAAKKAAPKAKSAAKPAADAGAGKKPRGLKAPRKAGADDLTVIEGIGPKLAETLNGWGVYHYDQIAKWGAGEVAYADNTVPRFKGRCTRDKWVAQAKIIVEEGIDAFLERAKTNDY